MKPRLSRHRQSPRESSGLRRMRPRALVPSPGVLRRLDECGRETLEKRLGETLECVYNLGFRRSKFLGENAPQCPNYEAVAVPKAEGSSPDPTATAVLSPEAERSLFLRFNYFRYREMQVLKRYSGRRLDEKGAREFLHWDRLAEAARTDIVRANTSLVLAMARRSRNSGVELSELVSEGNLALLRCVDKFDAARGFKFSTYACRAILASFSRAAAKAGRVRQHFPTTYDPALERSDYVERKREHIELECVEELRQILFENSAALSSVERRVLDARFALGQETAPKRGERRCTLDQVGIMLGVSKERVRQIQNQAIEKLRSALQERLPAAC